MPFPQHILLIEDDALLCDLVGRWATRDWPAPTELHCLGAVEDALPLVHGGMADCILLDMSLPGGLSDIPAVDALMSAMPPGEAPVPVIIVSAADPQRSLEALRHGAQEWVSKNDPDFRAKLTWAINQAWARYRHRQSLDATLRKPLEGTP